MYYIIAENIDCGYKYRIPQSMFLIKKKKKKNKMVYPYIHFDSIKVGFIGVYFHGNDFLME